MRTHLERATDVRPRRLLGWTGNDTMTAPPPRTHTDVARARTGAVRRAAHDGDDDMAFGAILRCSRLPKGAALRTLGLGVVTSASFVAGFVAVRPTASRRPWLGTADARRRSTLAGVGSAGIALAPSRSSWRPTSHVGFGEGIYLQATRKVVITAMPIARGGRARKAGATATGNSRRSAHRHVRRFVDVGARAVLRARVHVGRLSAGDRTVLDSRTTHADRATRARPRARMAGAPRCASGSVSRSRSASTTRCGRGF